MSARWIAPIAVFVLIAGFITGCGQRPSAAASNPPKDPSQWVVAHPSQKAVTIKLYAGENNGMNFNGEGNGAMVVTVPLGYNVTVDFLNVDNAQVHSAMIVPLPDHTLTSIPTSDVAFPHAMTPDPAEGTQFDVRQTFRFTANKAGRYAIVCDVPGHSAMGMWDALNIFSAAQAPSIAVHGK